MKAWVYARYGPPSDVMRLAEVPRPEPGPGEVLLRVEAVGLNGSDWEITAGTPLYSRIFGTFRPQHPTLGSDIAGVVQAVGAGVTRFGAGDRVFGDTFERWGGFAEYLTAPADKFVAIPEGMSFTTAAALPQSGTNGWQPIEDAHLTRDQSALILGACGSAGPYAIQFAKRAGARVTAVDRAEKLDLAREAGADEVLDYRETDVTRLPDRYNLILDYFATRSFFAYDRLLAPGGRYFFFGGHMRLLLALTALGGPWGRRRGKTFRLEAVHQTPERQARLAELVQAGEIRPMIGATVSFEEIPRALETLRAGMGRGKTVVVFGAARGQAS